MKASNNMFLNEEYQQANESIINMIINESRQDAVSVDERDHIFSDYQSLIVAAESE